LNNTVNNREENFLADLPPEIQEILDWYTAGEARGNAGPKLTEFAAKFLSWLIADHAVIPTIAVSAPGLLALTLLHHQRNPGNAGAWLNLGLALRRMACLQAQLHHSEDKSERLFHRALESLGRSLQLEPENNGKNIRAWIGQALTYHQMGLYEDEVRSCLQALDADRSDAGLWLFYAFALGAAGRKAKALSVIDDAYKAYLRAGRPQGLQYLFADIDKGRSPVEVLRKRGL
jgi:tetratricopeptide (TPR) repeat protein